MSQSPCDTNSSSVKNNETKSKDEREKSILYACIESISHPLGANFLNGLFVRLLYNLFLL